MSGPIATAVSAIFGLEASVASFVASIVTGTISGGIQVHDESGLLGRGTGGIVSLASILASVLFWIHMKRMMQLLSNVLLFAAADKIAKLLIILLAKGPPLLHEVRCRTTCNFPSNPSHRQPCFCDIFFFSIAVRLTWLKQLFGFPGRDQGPRAQHLLPGQKGSDKNV